MISSDFKAKTNQKFILFNNTAKLAKYLRFLGFDAIIAKHFAQSNIQRITNKDRRIIISRKNRKNLKDRVFRIFKDQPLDQFEEVKNLLIIDEKKIGSRCMDCNRLLDEISKEKVRKLVPEFIFENYSDFKFCTKCGKVY